ncbi:unnamed protein product [Cladocopium goreaui]|uniref:Adenosine 3'-phospho 5'-phosphosulfate transporter 2 n=1 Tax=Cladocopium goreaui TaxID=2562237 RepID=A0A9P1G2I7_9DINO|nr:unnamed protein product [Cladocopium goreaui]
MAPIREPRVVLVGVPLHRLSRNHQLPCLALLVLISSILAAALQERVLYVPGFRYTGWLAFLTSFTYMALAMVERVVERDLLRRGSFAEYVKLSFLTMGGMYFTNFSLHYLSYSLRVVFKSSKLVPVMLLGVVYLKKRYTVAQYAAVGLLTAGVVVFTLGDAKGRAFFNPVGIAFIVAGSLSDAMAANYEEKVFFSRMGCSASEVVLYSSALGSVWALLAEAFTGELLPALRHSWDHLEAVPLMLFASVFGYIAQSGVLLLIKHFGATAAEIVKSCRKVTTILISFMVYGKPWNGYHVAGTLLFVNSVAVERFNSGASKRFATLLFSMAGLVALRLVFGGVGPSTFSVVIDAGSAGTRVNVFRFDAWNLKLLDINGAAQVFVEEEPGVGDLNSSALALQLSRLLGVAMATVPMGQRQVTPLALRATRALEDLNNQQVDDLLDQMKSHIAAAGFKDAGIQPMGGSEEAIAEWTSVNMLMGCFQPGLRGVHSPVAIVDLGGATVQIAYYLHDRQASEAKRKHLDGYISRIKLPFGSGPVHIYRHSYGGYGLYSAKVRSYKEIEQAGFGLKRHPCLPSGISASLRVQRRAVVAEGAMNRFSCATLIDYILHKELPCMKDGQAAGPPKMGNCSFAGAWMGPGPGPQKVVLASYFYDRMRDVGMVSNYSQTIRAAVFAEQADRACSVTGSGLNTNSAPPKSMLEFPGLSMERLRWLCFDLTFQARLLQALGMAESQELLVVKKIQYHSLNFEASWALGVAIGQLNK